MYADFDVRSIKPIFKALVLEVKIWLIMNLLLISFFPELNDLFNITWYAINLYLFKPMWSCSTWPLENFPTHTQKTISENISHVSPLFLSDQRSPEFRCSTGCNRPPGVELQNWSPKRSQEQGKEGQIQNKRILAKGACTGWRSRQCILKVSSTAPLPSLLATTTLLH